MRIYDTARTPLVNCRTHLTMIVPDPITTAANRQLPHHTRLQNENVPDSLSPGTFVEQPSPEVCSQQAYVLICAVGMAPTCHSALG